MAETNVLTKKGKEELEQKLKNLVEVEQPKAFEELNFARSQGDLSENNDYDAAREKTEAIKTEIARIQYVLDHCTVIENDDGNGSSIVRMGAYKISVTNLDTGNHYSFSIVGSAEADPVNEKISNTCPVAQAILGKKEGDIVTIPTKKPYQLQIGKIENLD
jgi:transcription elongation factor GreA